MKGWDWLIQFGCACYNSLASFAHHQELAVNLAAIGQCKCAAEYAICGQSYELYKTPSLSSVLDAMPLNYNPSSCHSSM